jgi:hypothetical protein
MTEKPTQDQSENTSSEPDGRWPVWALAAVCYPVAVGAVAVNLFFASLLGQAIGWPAIPPTIAVLCGVVGGIPAAWVTGRWFRGKIDEAEGYSKPGA